MENTQGLGRYLVKKISLGLWLGFFLVVSCQIILAYRTHESQKRKITSVVKEQIFSLIQEKSYTGDLLHIQRDLATILSPLKILSSFRASVTEAGGKKIGFFENSSDESWTLATTKVLPINTPIGDLLIKVEIGGDHFLREAVTSTCVSIVIFAILFILINGLVTGAIQKDISITDALLADLKNFSIEDFDELVTAKELQETNVKALREARENFYIQLSKFKQKAISVNTAELKARFALQLAHDIQSPLAVLRSIEKTGKDSDLDSRKIIRMAVERIEEVAQGILQDFKGKAIEKEEVALEDIENVIQSVISEKRIEYSADPQFSISFEKDMTFQKCFSKFRRGSFKSILSNLVNNSRESVNIHEHSRVLINLVSENGFNVIEIKDNGKGIAPEHACKIFTTGFTTKDKGHGLGLSGAKMEIDSWNGIIECISIINQGTVIRITLEAYNEVIQIDDDKLIGISWKNYFSKMGVPHHQFRNISDFLSCANNFSKHSRIYVDSDLGEGIKGEVVSEKIYAAGFTNIYLSTGYPKESIDKPHWIRGIYGKNPKNV